MTEEDRAWAEGLSQEEFKDQYLNRFPWGSDVIPTVQNYLKPYLVEKRGIDKFSLDEMTEEEGEKPKKEKSTVDKETVYYCRGCKGEIKNSKGTSQGLAMMRSNHEKKCAEFQHTRTRPSL